MNGKRIRGLLLVLVSAMLLVSSAGCTNGVAEDTPAGAEDATTDSVDTPSWTENLTPIRGTDPAPIPPSDNTPPTISNVEVLEVTASSAVINWTTDEAANGNVEYGTTSNYGLSAAADGSAVANHSVSLTGLTDGTTYHFRVRAMDQSGNEATSDDQTFTTSSAPPVGQLTVHFIDVGQGDAILLDCGEDEVLIDGGSGDSRCGDIPE